jgi:hypothetical protein
MSPKKARVNLHIALFVEGGGLAEVSSCAFLVSVKTVAGPGYKVFDYFFVILFNFVPVGTV